MDKKGMIGILLITVSIVISLTKISITGAVIGSSVLTYFAITAVSTFIIGAFLLFASVALEQRFVSGSVVNEVFTEPGQFIENIRRVSQELREQTPRGKRLSFVVDTSSVGDYTKQGADKVMEEVNKNKEDVITPDSVLNELNSRKLRHLRPSVKGQTKLPARSYANQRTQSRVYLEQSDKSLYHEEIVPMVLGEKPAPRTKRGAAPYVDAFRKLAEAVVEKHLPITRKNVIKESEAHWKVSNPDVDVLACAWEKARQTHAPVLILEKDRHFEDAINAMKKAGVEDSEFLHYVNPYKPI